MAKKYIPKVGKKRKKELEKIWEEIYNLRVKKVSRNRSRISANAVVLSEVMKDCVIEEKPKKKKRILVEEKVRDKFYKYKDLRVAITTDKSILKRYKNVEGKGMFSISMPAFHQQIINKIVEKYNLNIDPKIPTYYIIKGNEEE